MSDTGLQFHGYIRKLALFGLCNNDECVYIFGGSSDPISDSPVITEIYCNDLWEYNIKANSFGVIPTDYPVSRISITLNYYNNYLYLFGGYSRGHIFFNELWKYSIKEKQWTEQKFLDDDVIPEKRSDHRSVVYKHYLIIFGGIVRNKILDKWECFNNIWIYDLKKEIWKCIKCSNKPKKRMLHGMAICNDNIIINGGSDDSYQLLDDTYFISVNDVINDSNPKWIKMDIDLGPLYSHLFLSYNNKFGFII